MDASLPDIKRAYARELVLLGAFVLLVVAAAYSVLLPELAREPVNAGDAHPAQPASERF